MSTRPRPIGIRSCAVLVSLAAAALLATAAPTLAQQSNLIRACVHKSSLQVRIISLGQVCSANESLTTWNVAGLQGPKGDIGPVGPQGPKGDPGGGLATGTIVGQLIGCHLAGRVISVPGSSFVAVSAGSGEFQMRYVPFGTYGLAVDLGPAQKAFGPVNVSEGGQDPSSLLLTLDDLDSDPSNCGECGHVCSAGTTCQGGRCGECTPGDTRACSTGLLGICQAGTQTCTGAKVWNDCVSNVSGQTEICNGIDDDCDGQVDNGSNTALCPSGGACIAGQCVGGTAPFAGAALFTPANKPPAGR